MMNKIKDGTEISFFYHGHRKGYFHNPFDGIPFVYASTIVNKINTPFIHFPSEKKIKRAAVNVSYHNIYPFIYYKSSSLCRGSLKNIIYEDVYFYEDYKDIKKGFYFFTMLHNYLESNFLVVHKSSKDNTLHQLVINK